MYADFFSRIPYGFQYSSVCPRQPMYMWRELQRPVHFRNHRKEYGGLQHNVNGVSEQRINIENIDEQNSCVAIVVIPTSQTLALPPISGIAIRATISFI